MDINTIEYSANFDVFLDSLNDKKRADLIISELINFVKEKANLDIKLCEHFENRNKAVIGNANVVVYFDIKDDRLIMIDGDEMPPRAS